MVNQLKADFYKIIHSKILLTVVLVCFASAFIGPIGMIVKDDVEPVLFYIAKDRFIQTIPFLVFACVFCTRDFSTGFVKNTTSVKKHHYLLSKTIYLFVLVLLLYAFKFALFTLGSIGRFARWGNAIFAGGTLNTGEYIDVMTAKRFLWGEAVYLTNMFAMGMIVLAVSCICRKEILVAIIILPYFFFCVSVWTLLEVIVAGQPLFLLYHHATFGQHVDMYFWWEYESARPSGRYEFHWYDVSIARMMLENVVWSVVAFGVSLLTLTKKEV